jgi:arylsulfatase A-like enzyme
MSQKNSKPNIIFILSDQQRWDTLGCYGQPLEVTPNLDRMAEDGVRFTHTFSCQPVCGPVRSALQTGKYPTETGCFRNAIALPQNEKTIAHYLSEAGYTVGYIGKWHLASTSQGLHHTLDSTPESDADLEAHYESSPIPPERRGGYEDYWMAADVMEFTSHGYGGFVFDKEMDRVDFTGYRADALTDFALEYIENGGGRAAGQSPFFLFLSFVEPHHQNDRHHYEGPAGSKERFKDFLSPPDLEGKPGDWKEEYPDYLGCCEALDRNVGRILEKLEELCLDENTLILYASDHGSHFRTRNRDLEENCYDDYKRSCHEASIHVPLIARGPGFEGGRTVERLVSLIDLPTTLLKAAGIERPAGMHGRYLQDIAADTGTGGDPASSEWQDEVFVQISESQVGRAIRTKKWKYSVRARGVSGIDNPGSDAYTEDYLYDLEADPWESKNLVEDPAYEEVRSFLAGRLKERMKEAGELPPQIKPV